MMCLMYSKLLTRHSQAIRTQNCNELNENVWSSIRPNLERDVGYISNVV